MKSQQIICYNYLTETETETERLIHGTEVRSVRVSELCILNCQSLEEVTKINILILRDVVRY